MISARFCVSKKQGTPNDGANVENILRKQLLIKYFTILKIYLFP